MTIPNDFFKKTSEPRPRGGSGKKSAQKEKAKSNAASNDDLQSQIAELEGSLEDKDQVISALTARLEKAAEQLDRAHRNGLDRLSSPSRPLGADEKAGNPVFDDLKSFLEEWEDIQLAASMGRVQLALDDIRQLVSDGLTSPAPTTAPVELTSPTPSATSDASDWEAMKAEMLGEAAPAETTDAAATAGPAAQQICEPLIDIDAFEAPAEVEETDDPAKLRKAIEERDAFIVKLLTALRNVGTQRYAVPDWSSLESAPAELVAQLENLRQRMTETLKVAEVELSMERARLGREEIRIRHLLEDQDREANHEEAGTEKDTSGKKGTRWRRLLGISEGE